MKNRNWKKNAAAIALVGAIAAGGVVAGAVATRQQITAELRPDIGLTLNGQAQTLNQSIIAYNGTTYLPIRNIGELLGMDVDWNGTTQTVILNEQTGTTTVTPSATPTTTPSTTPVTSTTTTGDIGLEKAKSIALADAGLTASQVTFTKAWQDWDDGRMVYDVDFYTSTAKYDYEILAADGTILQREQEAFNTGVSTGTTGDVGLEQAKSIALADAGLTASQVTFTKARQDWDDGRMVYDVDFYTSTAKYDYEISASGTVLQREQETFVTTGTGTGTSNGSYIGLEQAKSIALQRAGVSSSQVTFVKAEQDWDDGRMEYEIEFYVGRTEYEFTIDAISGAILDMDVDYN